jgi:hypothetical protein
MGWAVALIAATMALYIVLKHVVYAAIGSVNGGHTDHAARSRIEVRRRLPRVLCRRVADAGGDRAGAQVRSPTAVGAGSWRSLLPWSWRLWRRAHSG